MTFQAYSFTPLDGEGSTELLLPTANAGWRVDPETFDGISASAGGLTRRSRIQRGRLPVSDIAFRVDAEEYADWATLQSRLRDYKHYQGMAGVLRVSEFSDSEKLFVPAYLTKVATVGGREPFGQYQFMFAPYVAHWFGSFYGEDGALTAMTGVDSAAASDTVVTSSSATVIESYTKDGGGYTAYLTIEIVNNSGFTINQIDITNDTTGVHNVTYSEPLADGATLLIDCQASAIFVNGAFTMHTLTTNSGHKARKYMELFKGSNQLTYDFNGVTGNKSIRLNYHDTYPI